MKAKLKNREKFSKRDFIDAMIISGEYDYDVYAIADFGKGTNYMMLDCNKVCWYQAKFFNVIDNKTPSTWSKFDFSRCHKLRNKDYDFSIPIRMFYGPKELIEDSTFLFNVYENPELAHIFLVRFLEKNRYE